jgi:TonB family protein
LFRLKRNIFREQYQINLEKATIISLCLVILLFFLFPRTKLKQSVKTEGPATSIFVEDIPVTRQGVPRQPPLKPVVPIPSEDEFIPDDVTIEDTELNLDQFALSQGTGGSGTGGSGIMVGQLEIFQPRPIFEVIPEYSEDLQKKGIEGLVKLHLHVDRFGRVIDVLILENTTGSNACANAASDAAWKGRYIPAKKNGELADIWITRTYSFGLQK